MGRDSRVEKLQRLRTERTARANGGYYGTQATASGNVRSRPRHRNTGRTLLSLLIFIAIIGGVLYLAGQFLLSYRPSASGAQASRTITVYIRSGETGAAIASELQNDGLILNAFLYHWYLRLTGTGNNMQAGPHTLHTGMTMDQVTQALSTAPVAAPTVQVTIYPGQRAEEVATALANAGVASYNDVMHEVLQGSFSYPFLAGRPAGASLEGYLLPETYIFRKHGGAHYAIGRILRTFGQEVTPATIAAGTKLYGSFYKAVILASIVQREAGTQHDMYLIASVYTNRLFHDPTLSFTHLGADPTVQYAVNHAPNWWASITQGAINRSQHNPFNTYYHVGLPPAPIAEPSLRGIEATANPPHTPYYYFHHNNGSHGMSVFCTAQETNNCQRSPE